MKAALLTMVKDAEVKVVVAVKGSSREVFKCK